MRSVICRMDAACFKDARFMNCQNSARCIVWRGRPYGRIQRTSSTEFYHCNREIRISEVEGLTCSTVVSPNDSLQRKLGERPLGQTSPGDVGKRIDRRPGRRSMQGFRSFPGEYLIENQRNFKNGAILMSADVLTKLCKPRFLEQLLYRVSHFAEVLHHDSEPLFH